MNRVAYLVEHHHSPDQIDGIDYQILIEADYIVNASENGRSQQAAYIFSLTMQPGAIYWTQQLEGQRGSVK